VKDHLLVSFCKAGLRILFRAVFRIEYHGLDNIPEMGAALIVPNHQSYLDPLLVGAAVPRSVRYMTMKQLFRWPLLASFLRFYGAFPVATRSADKAAIKSTLKFLKAGELVIIFPEGGRTRDGKMMPFFQGFARIALLRNVSIVPVTVTGAHRVWPPARRFPIPHKVRVTFHPQIHPSDFQIEDGARPARIVERVKKIIRSAL
jgi:1-acyl-sn-glycerol-3-phosphate acyltransferase